MPPLPATVFSVTVSFSGSTGRSGSPAGERREQVIKTATFEALLEDAQPDGDGGYLFTLEGKTYRIADRDDVRAIAEQHGYIIIY